MGVTQYIGARYVPIFADPIEWNSSRKYEPLTIVLHGGNSYTSKQSVPKGIDISDARYWASTGVYNAQIEQYRDETAQALNIARQANADAINAHTAATSALNKANVLEPKVTALESDNAQNKADIEELKSEAAFGGLNGGLLAASKNINTQTWQLLYSIDGLNFWPIKELSPYIDYNVDDYCWLFQIGDWYILSSQRAYKSKDLVTWERFTNHPTNPYGDFRGWGFDICPIDDNTFYYIFTPAIDNTTQITNGVGTNSYVFHVWYGTATFDNDTGNFVFNAPQQLMQFGNSNDDSYIDPSLVYDEYTNKFVLAIKNEKTSIIEVWSGSTLNNLTKQNFGNTIIGCEACKLIKDNAGEIYLYCHAYMAGGNPTLTGVTLSNNRMNFVQRVTNHHTIINYSLLEPIHTSGLMRHMGVTEVNNKIARDVNKIGVIPCRTFRYPSSQEYIYASFNNSFDEFTIYNLPGMTLHIGGGLTGKTIHGKHVSTESRIEMISLSGGVTKPTYGTGFRTNGKQIPYNGDGTIAGYIVSENPNLWVGSVSA